MPSAETKSIAVLPFANMSDKKDSEFFADGITEEIINALTRIPDLRVTSRTSSFFYKGKNIPIPEIGEKLGVSLILEGSIRFGGNKVRITAQLIHAQDDFHFWSATWDRDLDDIFQVQDEISLLIADKAREFLGHFEVQEHLVQPQTQEMEAYEWLLKGRYHLRQWNPEDAKVAIDCYEKALAIDPNHAEVLVAKADAIGFLATTGFAPYTETWNEIKVLVDKALSINENLAEAHYQLANYYFFLKGDFKLSLQAMLKGKAVSPNYPEINQYGCFLYTLAGDKKEAKKYLEDGLKVDPLSPETRFFEAYFNYMTENYELALEQMEQLLVENDRNVPAHSIKAYILIRLGRYAEALTYFNSVPEEVRVVEDQLGIEALASIYLQREDAEERVADLEARAQTPEGFRADSFLLFIYAAQKAKAKAYDWIEKSVTQHSSFLLIQLNDPILGDFRMEERYQSYIKQVYVTDVVSAPVKDKKRLLSETEAGHFGAVLLKSLVEDEIFLDPDLSLKSLAGKIDLHPNKLSWLINELHAQNFNQFINGYRIEHFKKLAINPDNTQFSILGLAYESGFNSKTVFNTYFKKRTGQSPKAWIQAQ